MTKALEHLFGSDVGGQVAAVVAAEQKFASGFVFTLNDHAAKAGFASGDAGHESGGPRANNDQVGSMCFRHELGTLPEMFVWNQMEKGMWLVPRIGEK